MPENKNNGTEKVNEDAILAGDMTPAQRVSFASTAHLISLVAKILAEDLKEGRDTNAVGAVVFLSTIGEDFCRSLGKHYAKSTGKVRDALKAQAQRDGDDDAIV